MVSQTPEDVEANLMARGFARLQNTAMSDTVDAALLQTGAEQQAVRESRGERVTALLEHMRGRLAEFPGPSLHEISDDLHEDSA